MKTLKVTCLFFLMFFALSCLDIEEQSGHKTSESNIVPLTRAVEPQDFDWETRDWMPTPSGQPQIPMPWGGQGSISGFYGLDVVNDYKKVDGWRLVYSTFRDFGEELVDPYFVLYNIYRGTMRMYFYLTSPFIGTSTYLKDAVSLKSTLGVTSNILNYLDGKVVDINVNSTVFSQIQPKMPDGGMPLAGRRWYMIEYELAYDPHIADLNSNQIFITWGLNYFDISETKINGEAKSEIYGTIGTSGNITSDLVSEAGTGVLSIMGLDLLDKLTVSEETGENKLGLNKHAFKALVSGVTSAVSSFGGGMPKMAMSILSAVFGGSSTPSENVVSLKSKATIQLSGEVTSRGAVSSTPIDLKIPGTHIMPDVIGYIPLYEEPLGVFYWRGGATVGIKETITKYQLEDDIMGTGIYDVYDHYVFIVPQDYSQYVVINPAVLEVADVSIVSQEVYALVGDGQNLLDFPIRGTIYLSPWEADNPIPEIDGVAIKIIIKVEPKNGAPASYLCKTFKADDYKWT